MNKPMPPCHKIIPHYQPIIRMSDKIIVKHECLARFIDIEGVGLKPDDMEHLFDDESFLRALFERIMVDVVEYAKQGIPICANVDVKTIDEQFFKTITNLAAIPGVTEHVGFEITEKNIAKNLVILIDQVKRIQGLGYRVILDDFGAGGANIKTLEHIKFDEVKIDGHFAIKAAKDANGYEKMKLIVDLLRCYHTPIVAEHIQTQAVEDVVIKLGIEFGQGYLYGVPAVSIRTAILNHHYQDEDHFSSMPVQ